MSLLICFLTVSLVLHKLSRWLVSDALAGVGAGYRCAVLAGCRWCVVVVLVGCTAKFLETAIETAYGSETALVNIPGDSEPTPHSLKTSYICGIVLCDETKRFRECVYCDLPEAHLCSNHAH